MKCQHWCHAHEVLHFDLMKVEDCCCGWSIMYILYDRGGNNVLEREGYAISAGFSLGLVALGRGEDALCFMDTFVERLFQYVGGKETHNERSFSLTVSIDDHNRVAGQVCRIPFLPLAS
ncbi:anaphase-promoting complex subunit 1-like [Actinidia eriantha]|uniref:anaphase-promoting complex subunit 1-like n=1 Tax=Actinidia eriantha TaxID=165200 RepID=UPI00258ED8AE|nr:anaphase-promoting complex subunit 1-like [Actinidia eriantha]